MSEEQIKKLAEGIEHAIDKTYDRSTELGTWQAAYAAAIFVVKRIADLEKQVDILCEQYAKLFEENEWKPIATIPRDKFVLGYGGGLGNHVSGPKMDIIKYDDEYWDETGTELVCGANPTHWMHIPEKPQ